MPLHLTFIGKVVYPRLWNTTIDQSKGYKDYKYTALQDTSYFSGDHIIHYLVGAEFKPNGPAISVAPTTSRNQGLYEHSLILLLLWFWTQTKKLKPLPQKEFHPLLLCTCSVSRQYAIEQKVLVACGVLFADSIKFKDFLAQFCERHGP